jgi:hypothetical protein
MKFVSKALGLVFIHEDVDRSNRLIAGKVEDINPYSLLI